MCAEITKRILFLRPDGIYQIMGTNAEFPTLPVTAEGFEAGGRLIPFASLYRVTPRAAYYKEPMELSNHSTFDPRQK